MAWRRAGSAHPSSWLSSDAEFGGGPKPYRRLFGTIANWTMDWVMGRLGARAPRRPFTSPFADVQPVASELVDRIMDKYSRGFWRHRTSAASLLTLTRPPPSYGSMRTAAGPIYREL
jgi:hypothetical protein